MVAGVIELPDEPAPNLASPRLVDNGFTQRGQSGPAGRVDRPGSHWAMVVTFPPLKAEAGRVFTVRLTRAQAEGLRVEVPLLGVKQGIPGAPVVDGAGQTGTTLNARNLTPYYAAKEGFWLHIENVDGERCLHQVTAQVIADASGVAALSIWPPLWKAFADGDSIELAHPTIEGAIEPLEGWSLSVDRLVRFGGSIVIEEAA